LKRSQWTRRHHEIALVLCRFYINSKEAKTALKLVNQLLDSAKLSAIGRKYFLEAKQLEINVHELLGNEEFARVKEENLLRVVRNER
jgi:hypothetical protein